MPQSLSDIKSLLASHGLRPKHRFGQNFLHDLSHMHRIVEAAELAPGALVLEVGAGTGALSEQLLDAGAALVAVEIDSDLEPILHERLDRYGERAALIMGDVLANKQQLNPQVAQSIDRGAKLVANLPYNVASPLLVNLAIDHPAMSLAVVMVQREVGERLAAAPGGKDYGPLGVIVQAAFTVERIAVLSPGSFWPQPKVDSVVLRLRRRVQPIAPDLRRFAAFVHRLFATRRKQLGTILGRSHAAFASGQVDPRVRPEQLSVPQIAALSQLGS